MFDLHVFLALFSQPQGLKTSKVREFFRNC
jgi:hypothetical protein